MSAAPVFLFGLWRMSIFTTADRDAVKAAIVTAAVNGFSRVTIGGQTSELKPLKELMDLLQTIQADIAADNANSLGGMRFRKTIPPGCG